MAVLRIYLFFALATMRISWSRGDDEWLQAGGTWYGDPEGYGTSGGACGYGALDNTAYGKNVAAGSGPLFLSGLGCGSCFEVKCVSQPLCSDRPVRVVITDECPGGEFCGKSLTHFDLSGTAFGNMAVEGSAQSLRQVGVVKLLYRRVTCRYPGYYVTFKMDAAINSMWLAFVVQYQPGAGDIRSVELRESGSSEWKPMSHAWGAEWQYNGRLEGPLSVRITSSMPNQVLVAPDSIPAQPEPGVAYVSTLEATL